MRNRELQQSVENDMKINQLRSILSSLTDEDKVSYLELLKRVDKKIVEHLIEEKHMDPYSNLLLDQLEFQLNKQSNIVYDKHIIIQERQQENLIQNVLKEQGYEIDEVESASVNSDEVLIYSLDCSHRIATYHPTRLAFQESNNSQMIGSMRYLEEFEELQRKLRVQKNAQKEQACVNRCQDDKRNLGSDGL